MSGSEIEYLEEYEDLILPSTSIGVVGRTSSNMRSVQQQDCDDTDDDSSSIDQDIFESLFDNNSDEDLLNETIDPKLCVDNEGDTLEIIVNDLVGDMEPEELIASTKKSSFTSVRQSKSTPQQLPPATQRAPIGSAANGNNKSISLSCATEVNEKSLDASFTSFYEPSTSAAAAFQSNADAKSCSLGADKPRKSRAAAKGRGGARKATSPASSSASSPSSVCSFKLTRGSGRKKMSPKRSAEALSSVSSFKRGVKHQRGDTIFVRKDAVSARNSYRQDATKSVSPVAAANARHILPAVPTAAARKQHTPVAVRGRGRPRGRPPKVKQIVATIFRPDKPPKPEHVDDPLSNQEESIDSSDVVSLSEISDDTFISLNELNEVNLNADMDDSNEDTVMEISNDSSVSLSNPTDLDDLRCPTVSPAVSDEGKLAAQISAAKASPAILDFVQSVAAQRLKRKKAQMPQGTETVESDKDDADPNCSSVDAILDTLPERATIISDKLLTRFNDVALQSSHPQSSPSQAPESSPPTDAKDISITINEMAIRDPLVGQIITIELPPPKVRKTPAAVATDRNGKENAANRQQAKGNSEMDRPKSIASMLSCGEEAMSAAKDDTTTASAAVDVATTIGATCILDARGVQHPESDAVSEQKTLAQLFQEVLEGTDEATHEIESATTRDSEGGTPSNATKFIAKRREEDEQPPIETLKPALAGSGPTEPIVAAVADAVKEPSVPREEPVAQHVEQEAEVQSPIEATSTVTTEGDSVAGQAAAATSAEMDTAMDGATKDEAVPHLPGQAAANDATAMDTGESISVSMEVTIATTAENEGDEKRTQNGPTAAANTGTTDTAAERAEAEATATAEAEATALAEAEATATAEAEATATAEAEATATAEAEATITVNHTSIAPARDKAMEPDDANSISQINVHEVQPTPPPDHDVGGWQPKKQKRQRSCSPRVNHPPTRGGAKNAKLHLMQPTAATIDTTTTTYTNTDATTTTTTTTTTPDSTTQRETGAMRPASEAKRAKLDSSLMRAIAVKEQEERESRRVIGGGLPMEVKASDRRQTQSRKSVALDAALQAAAQAAAEAAAQAAAQAAEQSQGQVVEALVLPIHRRKGSKASDTIATLPVNNADALNHNNDRRAKSEQRAASSQARPRRVVPLKSCDGRHNNNNDKHGQSARLSASNIDRQEPNEDALQDASATSSHGDVEIFADMSSDVKKKAVKKTKKTETAAGAQAPTATFTPLAKSRKSQESKVEVLPVALVAPNHGEAEADSVAGMSTNAQKKAAQETRKSRTAAGAQAPTATSTPLAKSGKSQESKVKVLPDASLAPNHGEAEADSVAGMSTNAQKKAAQETRKSRTAAGAQAPTATSTPLAKSGKSQESKVKVLPDASLAPNHGEAEADSVAGMSTDAEKKAAQETKKSRTAAGAQAPTATSTPLAKSGKSQESKVEVLPVALVVPNHGKADAVSVAGMSTNAQKKAAQETKKSSTAAGAQAPTATSTLLAKSGKSQESKVEVLPDALVAPNHGNADAVVGMSTDALKKVVKATKKSRTAAGAQAPTATSTPLAKSGKSQESKVEVLPVALVAPNHGEAEADSVAGMSTDAQKKAAQETRKSRTAAGAQAPTATSTLLAKSGKSQESKVEVLPVALVAPNHGEADADSVAGMSTNAQKKAAQETKKSKTAAGAQAPTATSTSLAKSPNYGEVDADSVVGMSIDAQKKSAQETKKSKTAGGAQAPTATSTLLAKSRKSQESKVEVLPDALVAPNHGKADAVSVAGMSTDAQKKSAQETKKSKTAAGAQAPTATSTSLAKSPNYGEVDADSVVGMSIDAQKKSAQETKKSKTAGGAQAPTATSTSLAKSLYYGEVDADSVAGMSTNVQKKAVEATRKSRTAAGAQAPTATSTPLAKSGKSQESKVEVLPVALVAPNHGEADADSVAGMSTNAQKKAAQETKKSRTAAGAQAPTATSTPLAKSGKLQESKVEVLPVALVAPNHGEADAGSVAGMSTNAQKKAAQETKKSRTAAGAQAPTATSTPLAKSGKSQESKVEVLPDASLAPNHGEYDADSVAGMSTNAQKKAAQETKKSRTAAGAQALTATSTLLARSGKSQESKVEVLPVALVAPNHGKAEAVSVAGMSTNAQKKAVEATKKSRTAVGAQAPKATSTPPAKSPNHGEADADSVAGMSTDAQKKAAEESKKSKTAGGAQAPTATSTLLAKSGKSQESKVEVLPVALVAPNHGNADAVVGVSTDAQTKVVKATKKSRTAASAQAPTATSTPLAKSPNHGEADADAVAGMSTDVQKKAAEETKKTETATSIDLEPTATLTSMAKSRKRTRSRGKSEAPMTPEANGAGDTPDPTAVTVVAKKPNLMLRRLIANERNNKVAPTAKSTASTTAERQLQTPSLPTFAPMERPKTRPLKRQRDTESDMLENAAKSVQETVEATPKPMSDKSPRREMYAEQSTQQKTSPRKEAPHNDRSPVAANAPVVATTAASPPKRAHFELPAAKELAAPPSRCAGATNSLLNTALLKFKINKLPEMGPPPGVGRQPNANRRLAMNQNVKTMAVLLPPPSRVQMRAKRDRGPFAALLARYKCRNVRVRVSRKVVPAYFKRIALEKLNKSVALALAAAKATPEATKASLAAKKDAPKATIAARATRAAPPAKNADFDATKAIPAAEKAATIAATVATTTTIPAAPKTAPETMKTSPAARKAAPKATNAIPAATIAAPEATIGSTATEDVPPIALKEPTAAQKADSAIVRLPQPTAISAAAANASRTSQMNTRRSNVKLFNDDKAAESSRTTMSTTTTTAASSTGMRRSAAATAARSSGAAQSPKVLTSSSPSTQSPILQPTALLSAASLRKATSTRLSKASSRSLNSSSSPADTNDSSATISAHESSQIVATTHDDEPTTSAAAAAAAVPPPTTLGRENVIMSIAPSAATSDVTMSGSQISAESPLLPPASMTLQMPTATKAATTTTRTASETVITDEGATEAPPAPGIEAVASALNEGVQAPLAPAFVAVKPKVELIEQDVMIITPDTGAAASTAVAAAEATTTTTKPKPTATATSTLIPPLPFPQPRPGSSVASELRKLRRLRAAPSAKGASSPSLDGTAVAGATAGFGGARVYSFLHPDKYNRSHSGVMLDFCCPNLEGPMSAIDPVRSHSQVDTIVVELPEQIVMTTSVLTSAQMAANPGRIPAAIRQKVERLATQTQPALDTSLSNKLHQLQLQLPRNTSITEKSLPAATSLMVKVPTSTECEKTLRRVQLRRFDGLLMKYSEQLATKLSFHERQRALERIVETTRFSSRELETTVRVLDEYTLHMGMISAMITPLAITSTALPSSSTPPPAQSTATASAPAVAQGQSQPDAPTQLQTQSQSQSSKLDIQVGGALTRPTAVQPQPQSKSALMELQAVAPSTPLTGKRGPQKKPPKKRYQKRQPPKSHANEEVVRQSNVPIYDTEMRNIIGYHVKVKAATQEAAASSAPTSTSSPSINPTPAPQLTSTPIPAGDARTASAPAAALALKATRLGRNITIRKLKSDKPPTAAASSAIITKQKLTPKAVVSDRQSPAASPLISTILGHPQMQSQSQDTTTTTTATVTLNLPSKTHMTRKAAAAAIAISGGVNSQTAEECILPDSDNRILPIKRERDDDDFIGAN